MVLASVSGSITHEVALHGLYAVFVLMAIDAVFPAGSELVMVFAGAIAAGVGTASIDLLGARVGPGLAAYLLLAASGTLGYLAGSCLGWLIGKRGGRAFVSDHGRWLHVSPSRLDKAERWFQRWGSLGVLVGRLLPLVRSFVSIPAGVLGMAFAPYVALTFLGSAVWCFGLAGVGWAVGSSYTRFDSSFSYAEYGVVAVVVMALMIPLLAKLRSLRSGRRRLRNESGH